MQLVYEGHYVSEAGFLVYKNEEGKFALYEIPLYGGEERFSGIFDTLEEAKALGESWT